MSPEEDRTRDAVDSVPKHYQQAISAPKFIHSIRGLEQLSQQCVGLTVLYCLIGLVVKASALRAEGPGFESACAGIFPGSSHTSDFKTGTPVATLPGAWRYRVSAGNGRPGVSIL